ncbi:MAG TPA: thermonuclease family protein [Solirubrobacterales bacterium]|nr:thermonuclease family protein [Solirubrobacterales bacterium]
MNRLGSAVLLLLAVVVLLRPWEGLEGLWEEPEPASVRALVTRVVDGDTVEARFGGREEDVRLIGIDTPETVKPDTPVQCFGPQASDFSHRLLEGQRVRLVFGVERRDIYGRLLAYAYLDRRMANAELLRRGLARTLTIPPNDRFAERFARLETAAARAGRGLWGACGS